MALTKITTSVVAVNSLTTANIADNSIDATKIASNSILTRHIDDAQITTDQILDGTIATADIADDAVTEDKLANAINTSIAAKLPLAGGTMTGNITLQDDTKVIFGTGDDLHIYHHNGHNYIDISTGDQDLIIKGTDGSTDITALTLDMSDLGTAYFNSSIVIPDNLMHTGDLNTYIGFPADDAFRVVTGGGEAIRVTSAQLVGINTTAPDTYLEVDIKNDSDGNGIHITSTSTTNDPSLKISRNGGAADVFSMRPRGGAGSAYFAIAPGSTLDGGINMKQNGYVGLGGNNAPVSLLHMYGDNTADVASNGAGINGLQLSRTSSKGENIYAYMTDGSAASSSWAGLGNVGKIESFGNNAFEIGTQQDATVVIGQNNTQKIRIKGDITAHAKFGATYIESLYTPNGGVQNCRIFEDHLGKWVAVGYFAADAKLSIQTTWGSARGAPTGLGQSETTVFSADWGDSYPTEVRYLGATDFNNFQETKTIDFIHGVPVGRPWKQFFNNAHRTPDGGTDVSVSLMGKVQGSVGSLKNGWECRGAYDGRGRWHNADYTHHRMSDDTGINCADTAFTTPTSSHFNWEAASDAKISVHHSNDYSGQDGITSAGFGNDDNIVAFFDDYPTDRTNFGSTSNNYTSAVYVLMKLPEMQSIGLQGGRSRDHQPGEVVQTRVYEKNSDVSTTGAQTTYGYIDFTPKYGNSLLEFNIHANTGATADTTAAKWQIYKGSSSAIGTKIRETGNQLLSGYDSQVDGMPLPFSYTQYYQLNDDKKSEYRYTATFSCTGGRYYGHTYGGTTFGYFSIKEIKQEHNAKLITD